LHGRFRLLPSEQVVWQGRPIAGATRDWHWLIVPALLGTIALSASLFAVLLKHTGQPGAGQLLWMAVYFAALGVATGLAPSFLHDRCEFMVTDMRVLWRRGPLSRWIDSSSISYARIHWNRGRSDIGHLELVRASPFGPLLRKQRLWLHNVHMPDRLLVRIEGSEPGVMSGDRDISIADRLPESEHILWGDHPHGHLLSTRNVMTALLGVAVLLVACRYGSRAWGAMVVLENHGLQVRSWTWALLFSGTAVSWLLVLTIAAGLLWHGLWRARSLGHQTEYVITDKRVVIRRGRTELYLNRRHIVDVAIVPTVLGMRHLFLILDAPDGRALADHGAMTPLPPARDLVAPIMYELNDSETVRRLLLDPPGSPAPELGDAA